MNKEKYRKVEKELLERGYRRYDQNWNLEDYVIGKGFHKEDNKFEEDRSAYQILLSIYDMSLHKEWWDRMSSETRQSVGITIRFGISRTVNERIDLEMSWHDDTKIEDVEEFAENFFKFIQQQYPKPRK